MAKIRSFAEDQIIRRIRLENPWWDSNQIPSDFRKLKPRLYFNPFASLAMQVNIKRAIVLMGPRRAGKTVMLFQLIQRLIDTGTSPRKICFLSIDAPIYSNMPLDELFHLCQKALNDETGKEFYIIFDEIQYLKNWEVHLKSMVDFYPSSNRFIVSGSAAAALKLKSNESGAGRFTEFMLPSLLFAEYLYLKDLSYLVTPKLTNLIETGTIFESTEDWQTLNEHFIQYINFGGYPEVIFNNSIQQDPGKFIRSDIIDKVLLRDLPSLYGIRDVQELNSLFNVIAYNSGNEFNLEGLSQGSGVDKNTIRKYIEYLEAAFLIKILYPVGINTKRFQRDSRFKIYLTNPSMRCALFAPIQPSDDHFSQMVETAIVAQWLHWGNIPLHFAAWKGGEVDLVMVKPDQKPLWAMEVKWSNQYLQNPGKLKSLMTYCKENDLNQANITTIDKFAKIEYQTLVLSFIPAPVYCYSIGRDVLAKKALEAPFSMHSTD